MIVTRAGVDRSTNYLPDELNAISVILAGWDGETGQGTIPVPDPAGNQEPYEGEQLLLEQDSQTIVDGFLGAVTSERGGTAIGARRVHTMTLADDNALLSGHATSSWIRPAESAHARWAAFVSDFLPGSLDTTWLLTTNESGITLPKKTYRSDSLFDDISADTIGPTGKTVYIEHRNFHWHLPTEGQTCSIVIHDTNTPTSTSFRPLTVNRQKDGMDLRNKLYARNEAGVEVSVTDATSVTRHDAGGLKHQGYSEYGTETAAEMTRDLNVTLLERKAERTTWTYQIGPLTAAQAVALIPGSQMTVTVGVHSLSAAVKRIARVTLTYRHGREAACFMATVELGYPRRVKRKPTKTSSPVASGGGSGVSGSGGNGGCDGCVPFDASTPQHWWYGTYTATCAGATGGSIADSDGGGQTVYADVHPAGTAVFVSGTTYSYALGLIVDGTCDYDYTIGVGSRAGGIHGIGFVHALGGSGSHLYTPGEAGTWSIFNIVAHGASGACGSSSHTVNVTFWVDPAGWVALQPTSGQAVSNDRTTGDGSTTSFTTTYPYRPGTLHVTVNGIDNTDDVTATDGTTAVFAHPPLLNADIVFVYDAA